MIVYDKQYTIRPVVSCRTDRVAVAVCDPVLYISYILVHFVYGFPGVFICSKFHTCDDAAAVAVLKGVVSYEWRSSSYSAAMPAAVRST